MYLKFRYFVFIIVLFIIIPLKNFAQNERTREVRNNNSERNIAIRDSVPVNDTISGEKPKRNENVLDSKVIYSAKDSIALSSDSKKVFLYKEAKIIYGEIILEADYIEYDQEKNYVFATGVTDSLGELTGKPKFKEGEEEFIAKTIKYNFKTKKGYIEDVFTEEEQGFLHSEQTNKLADNSFLLKNGKYTTCDHEDHPHFYLSMTKAKVIPNDKIITGPAYLVLLDIPFKFLGVPFGFFPNQSGYSSGLIPPKYGEENNRGFYLQGGGYYFGISERMDLAVTGDIFSKGSWGGDVNFRYKKRYKFSSNFNFSYAEFIKSEEGLPDYEKNKNMQIKWSHIQDAKANPNSKFSASVNYSTTGYDKYNARTTEQLNTNTKSSSISYGKNWAGSPFRFNMDLKHSQNSKTNNVSLTLPVLTFNMDRQYPFRSKNSSGETKWYEDIEVQYSSKLENKIITADSLLFNGTKFSDFENGFQHSVPLSTNFKLLKYFNLSPKVEYTGILYPNYVEYSSDTLRDEDGELYVETTETIVPTIRYAQLIEPSVSLSVGPNIYGMYRMKSPEGKIEALRHVVTPSVGVSYRPDMGSMVDKYYGEYLTDTLLSEKYSTRSEYSIFDNGIYNFPAAPGQSGSISFGLSNNLEMKVRSNSDTSSTSKKVKILESFKISTSYNIFADSLNWSVISIRGRTSIFNNKLKLNFGANLDPYALNSDGNVINQFQWNTKDGGVGRLEKIDFSVDFQLQSKKGESEEGSSKGGNSAMGSSQMDDFRDFANDGQYNVQDEIVTYVDFDIPWNLSANYKFVYSKTGLETSKKITQTISLSGGISLTKKWKISFRSNYDIAEKELSSTSININRELHCWEMTFSWIPVGYMQSYNFQINVKSSTLRDMLKYDKRKSWQDNL
ncbi:MAG: LPS-assembly protein LptD [Bacteroidales bacterium]|nr:LPS-assembly protein LptD [Bacteroidales bacterium]